MARYVRFEKRWLSQSPEDAHLGSFVNEQGQVFAWLLVVADRPEGPWRHPSEADKRSLGFRALPGGLAVCPEGFPKWIDRAKLFIVEDASWKEMSLA